MKSSYPHLQIYRFSMSRTGVTKSHLRKFRNPIQLSNIIFLFPNILRTEI